MALPGPCSESLPGHRTGAAVPPRHRPAAPRKGSVPGLTPVPSTALLVTSSSTGNTVHSSGEGELSARQSRALSAFICF